MAKLGNLYISLVADTASFSSGLSKARSDLNSTSALMNAGLAKIDKSFQGLGHGLKDVAGEVFSLRGALTALIGTIGIGSIAEMAKQAVEAVGGLGELASQVGVSTDLLQSLNYAATQVGLSSEEMQKGIAKLNDTIGAAVAGEKTAIDVFERLGIKILDVNGAVRPTEAIMRDVADAIQRLPDPAVRAAAAVDLMGRAGQKLLPFLENGARGIDELVQKARDLGLVFDTETIRRADEAADKLATLSLVLKTQFQAALVELAPFLSEFADEMVNVAHAVNEFFDRIRPDDEKSLQGLEDKFNRLTDLQDKLIADRDALVARKAARSFMDDIFGTDIDAEIAQKTREIAGLTVDLENLQMRIDSGMLAKSEASTAPAALPGAGVYNPKPSGGGKTDAEKEIEAAQKKLQQLQAQVAEIGKTGADLELTKALEGLNMNNPGVAALVDQFRQAAEAIAADKEQTEALDRAWKQAQDSMAAWNAEQQKGQSITESLRTPTEQYAATMADLSKLLSEGAISQETFNRAQQRAQKVMDDAEDGAKSLNSAMASLGASWSSAFEDAALAMDDAGFSAKSLGDVLKGLLQDVERLLLRIGVTDPIAEGIAGIDWSSLFSSSPGKYGVASGKMQNTSSGGGFWSWIGDFFSSLFHSGGVVGRDAAPRRAVPAALFAGAPRFHGGMLAAGEYPAILKRDESVLTPAQMAQLGPRGSGGDTVVNIIDQRGSGQIEQRESRSANGQKQIDILVKDSFDRLAGRGSLDKTLGLNYGIKRKPSRGN